jgi:CRP-like cAMP-binding protein
MDLRDIPTEKLDPWFVTWDYGGQALEGIRDYAEEVVVPAGKTIFSEGDPSDAMYLVLEGMVQVLKTDENGREQTVSIIVEGQSFGEIGLLVKQTRSATTAAGLESRLLKVSGQALEKLEKEKPEALLGMYKALAQTLAEQWMISRTIPTERHKEAKSEG